MDNKIISSFGVSKAFIDNILPILVEYARIDKTVGPIGYWKLRDAVRDKAKDTVFDKNEWEFYKKVRYLYSIVMSLSKEELALLRRIIDILLGGE